MYPTYQTHTSSGSLSPPSQQNKVILQREYREKEGECINTLRDIIKDLTGEELRTRYEILRKAIDILSGVLEDRKQNEALVNALTPYETPPTKPEGTASAHEGHFTQSPHYSQSWHSGAELDAAFPYYGAHVQDQQYHFMSGTDSAQAFNMASSLGYGKDLSGYPPL